MILTASMTSEIDEAMLCTARVDLSLVYGLYTRGSFPGARVLHVLLVRVRMGVY